MTAYFGALTIVLLFATVLTRALMMRRQGIQAMNFGKLDKTDFIIPPFALFYFYLVFANAFGWPSLTTQQFFEPETIAWLGVGLCLAGLAMLLWSLVAFGRSFQVGIDTEAPDKLVTTGVFGFSRNPIYLGFACILLGEFLIFPNWILLAYLVAGFWLLHRQVLREEAFLRQHYGQEYDEYAQRVRRYL